MTLNANGTFTYVPTGTATSDSFTYCANGTVTGTTCSSGITATVTLGASTITDTLASPVLPARSPRRSATYLAIKTPGVLADCKDAANLPLTVVPSSVTAPTGIDGSSRMRTAGSPRSRRGAGTYILHLPGAELPGNAQRRDDRDGHLPGGERPDGERAGRT